MSGTAMTNKKVRNSSNKEKSKGTSGDNGTNVNYSMINHGSSN